MAFIQAVQAGDVVPLTELLARFDDVLAGVALPRPVESPEQESSVRTVEKLPADSRNKVVSAESAQPGQERKTAAVSAKPENRQEPVPQPEEIPLPPEPVTPEPVAEEQQREEKVEVADRKKNVRADWPEFIEYVRDRKKWMAGALERASSVQLEGERLTIVYNDSVDCRIIKNRENLIPLTEFAMDFFQENLQITFKVPDSSACDTDPDSSAAVQQERLALANDPLVLAALDIFNGQVGDIRVGPRFRKPLSQGKPNQDSDN